MDAIAPPEASWTRAHRQFQEALDRMNRSFRFAFRRRRPQDRAEAIAEASACAWKAWYGLIRRGKDPLAVGVSGIAGYAIKHTLNGRRIGHRGGGRGAMDVYHPRAQRAGGFRLLSATAPDRPGDGWTDWLLADGRRSPADEAAFRIDFRAWLDRLPPRKRLLAQLLARGHGTGAVARSLGVTPAAVSQARSWLAADWRRFQGEIPGAPERSPHTPGRIGPIPG
jgi:hypothetical protein